MKNPTILINIIAFAALGFPSLSASAGQPAAFYSPRQPQTVAFLQNSSPSTANQASLVEMQEESLEVSHLISTSELQRTVINSYQVAFGRNPTTSELNYWVGRARSESVNSDMLLENHQGWLSSNSGSREVQPMITRSYQEILRRSPNTDEINYWRSRVVRERLMYVDLLEAHRNWRRGGGT